MLFNSVDFLVFFPVVTLFYFLIPKKIRNYWLLIASYFFYMCWNPKYLFLLLGSTLITYLSGLLIEKVKNSSLASDVKTMRKNYIVAASFTLNIGLLFYFKYINFALDLWQQLLGNFGIAIQVPTFDIILPVGISFYIFQALSYTMDIYRDEIYAEKNFFRYALFVSFFPQLVAGPIERSKNLLRQFATPKSFDYDNVRNGLLTMLWGYFIKVVLADRLGILVDTVYDNPSDFHGMEIIVAAVAFTMQIYSDFMGYSIIAKGTARVLGFDLMSNFEMPYFATSIKDFWRRWHISLSSWLRDYLYIPLGGNRKGATRKYLNTIITFFVSGLWHGANVTFVVWGLTHGFCQILEDIFRRIFGDVSKKIENTYFSLVWKDINIVKTFILVTIGWIFFRADTISMANKMLASMTKLDNVQATLTLDGMQKFSYGPYDIIIVALALVLLIISSVMREYKIDVLQWISNRLFIIRYPVYWIIVTLIIFSIDLTGKEFIYFQF